MTNRNPIRTLTFVLVLALASLALAQSDRAIVTNTMERLGGWPVDCTASEYAWIHDAYFGRGGDTTHNDVTYCGAVPDAMTDINKRWTAEEMRSYGYTNVTPGDWYYDSAGAQMQLYGAVWSGRGASAATILVVLDNQVTVVLFGFDK